MLGNRASPEQKAMSYRLLLQQNQPIEIPYDKGKVLVSPTNPCIQQYIPRHLLCMTQGHAGVSTLLALILKRCHAEIEGGLRSQRCGAAYSNLANNLFASSCDNRRPAIFHYTEDRE
jgi:hypothetical protein